LPHFPSMYRITEVVLCARIIRVGRGKAEYMNSSLPQPIPHTLKLYYQSTLLTLQQKSAHLDSGPRNFANFSTLWNLTEAGNPGDSLLVEDSVNNVVRRQFQSCKLRVPYFKNVKLTRTDPPQIGHCRRWSCWKDQSIECVCSWAFPRELCKSFLIPMEYS